MQHFCIEDKLGRTYDVTELRAADYGNWHSYGVAHEAVMRAVFPGYEKDETAAEFYDWGAGTHVYRRHCRPLAHIVHAPFDNNAIAGFALASYLIPSQTAMLMFMGFLPQYQKINLAKPLVDYRIAALDDIARDEGKTLKAVFAEVHKAPPHTQAEGRTRSARTEGNARAAGGISDEKRVEAFKERLGASNIVWLDGYLDPHQDAYNILSYPVGQNHPPVTGPRIVRAMLKDWYQMTMPRPLQGAEHQMISDVLRQAVCAEAKRRAGQLEVVG